MNYKKLNYLYNTWIMKIFFAKDELWKKENISLQYKNIENRNIFVCWTLMKIGNYLLHAIHV